MRMTMRVRVSSEARRVGPGTALLLLLGLIGAVGGLVGCERLGLRPVGGDGDGEPPPPEVQILDVLAAPTEVPGDLAWDGEALWVADVAGEALHRVSPVDGRVLAQVRLPGLGVLVLGVAWDGEALWVAMPLDGALYRLAPSSGRVLARLRLPEAVTDPRGLTWDEAGRALWLLDGAAGLLQLDLRDGRVLQGRAVTAEDPQGLAWDGERFWLIARERSQLERVTPLGEAEAAWPLPPPIAAPAGLVWTGVLAPGQGELWLSDEASGALFRLRVPDIGLGPNKPEPGFPNEARDQPPAGR